MLKSDDFEKRLQHQLYLAKENPEPIFDVSNCNLSKIPNGSFALCKVLRKKKVLLNNNKLRSINENNNLNDLVVVTHLFIQFNEILKLSDDIDHIQYLEVLDVSNNKLKCLPESIGNLRYLRKLYLGSNDISNLPQSLFCENSSLTTVDVSENNRFTKIQPEIVKLKKLKLFIITQEYLCYPTDVIEKPIRDIINYACKDVGLELDAEVYERLSSSKEVDGLIDVSEIDAGHLDYDNLKKNRFEFLKSVESECNKLVNHYNQMMHKSSSEKDILLKRVLEEEAMIAEALNRIHAEHESCRQHLLDNVKAEEQHVKFLIDEIQNINNASQHREKLIDTLERENIQKFNEYQVYNEGVKKLRKKEILDAMNVILNSQEEERKNTERQTAHRKHITKMLRKTKSEDEKSMKEVFKEQVNRQKEMLIEVEKMNTKQREAFQQLQIRKDIQMLRLLDEISWVESELKVLSQMECKRRLEREENEINILSNKRNELVKVLDLLFCQKADREKQLQKRLMEMEEQRKNLQVDYWLVQYQRLLDTKPYSFQEGNCSLDSRIIEVLKKSNAMEYLPFFQREKITWPQMLEFNKTDLIKLSVVNDNKRKAMLQMLNRETKKKDNRGMQLSDSGLNNSTFNVKPSAPQDSKNNDVGKSGKNELNFPSGATAVQPEIVNAFREIECCICMEYNATSLFMNCGHICCCDKCSSTLQECPMCRQTINRIINIFGI